jgi:hypothetical protein
MKLDCILTSVNEKKLYLDFVPIFIKTWNRLYPDVDVKIILIAKNIPENLLLYKKNILIFEPIDDVLTSFTSQFIRLLYPCILNYKNGVLITDIDMLPMNKTYYTKNIIEYDNTKFIYYRDKKCFQIKQIAMCYNVATPEIWKDIFKINSLDDIVNYIKNISDENIIKEGHGNIGWSIDQKILYNKIMEWNKKTNNFVCLNEIQTGFKRLDRNKFDISCVKIRKNITNCNYTDYHCFRPMSKYSNINWEIYNLLPKREINKVLILFKIGKLDNEIHKITDKYCSKFKNSIEYYYLYSDETIVNDIEFVDNNIIKMKIKEDNWSSLLIKVIKAFNIFKDKPYSNIIVSNVSTFLNIPVLLKLIDKNIPCLSHQGYNYNFKNKIYNFPSGAGYIFNMEIVNQICDFFNKNKFIEYNKLSNNFSNNYPTTDDIFFGYFLHLNNINIKQLDRFDLIKNYMEINNIPSIKNTSHIRIKTSDQNISLKYFKLCYDIIYL